MIIMYKDEVKVIKGIKGIRDWIGIVAYYIYYIRIRTKTKTKIKNERKENQTNENNKDRFPRIA